MGALPIPHTGLRDWVRRTRTNWNENGPVRAIAEAVYCLGLGPWFTLTSRRPFGVSIYDREWDVLVILDACRIDALAAVAGEYSFLPPPDDVGRHCSVGSGSREWLVKNFTTDRIEDVRRTAIVTANGFTNGIFIKGKYLPGISVPFCYPSPRPVEAEDFAYFDPVWHDCRDERYGTPLPMSVTERAILAGREQDFDRLVVHYNQPHRPHIGRALRDDRELLPWEADPLGELRSGENTRGFIWSQYLDSLRCALDAVEVLLENIDADRVIISADHGESFGEWGIHGHPTALPHPHVKWVPWATTTVPAVDRGTVATDDIEPPDRLHGAAAEEARRDHLRALGYVD